MPGWGRKSEVLRNVARTRRLAGDPHWLAILPDPGMRQHRYDHETQLMGRQAQYMRSTYFSMRTFYFLCSFRLCCFLACFGDWGYVSGSPLSGPRIPATAAQVTSPPIEFYPAIYFDGWHTHAISHHISMELHVGVPATRITWRRP